MNIPGCWLAFGLVAGLGLLTKETILFWGFALVVGLLLTRQRRLLFNRWTLFGGLIAFVLVSPFLIWNAFNGWASLQYWAGYSHNQLGGGSPLAFLVNQIVVMNPISVFLWGAGLWYFFSKRGARYRVFGWAFLILFVLFTAIQGKILLSDASLPAVVCRWGSAGRYMASALAQVDRGLCRAAGPDWPAAGPRGDSGVAPQRVWTDIWQEQQRGGKC